MNELKEWCRRHDAVMPKPPITSQWRWPSIDALLADRGREFRSAPLTARECKELGFAAEIILPLLKVNDFPRSECFSNSQLIARYNREFRYVEGFVFIPVATGVVRHAWVTIHRKVVDVTLRFTSREKPMSPSADWPHRAIGSFPASRRYFSVEIPLTYFRQVSADESRKYIDSMLHDWKHGWPLLQHDAPWPRRW